MNNSDIDLLTIETLSERPDLTGVTRDMIKEFLLLPDSWVLKIEGAEPERLPSFLQDELALLPNWPAPPDGLVAVALFGLKPAGTAQIRRIDGRICELKRMFVREEFQQLGVGRQLVKFLTDWGRKLSYG
ncbi:MAG TPA: GNAT family N-acetyltransferase, partial [Acidimicrobiales bacterium]|nr:GNAT family N-acetyltransferase [Acidimicrobiales bacterium]